MAKKKAATAAPTTPSQYGITVFRNAAKQWQWRIVHQNGNILATSEAYSGYLEANKVAKNLACDLKCKCSKA